MWPELFLLINEEYNTIKNQSNYPFKLDEWQMKSMKANINKENVLVTAHTGSGITFVAGLLFANFAKYTINDRKN